MGLNRISPSSRTRKPSRSKHLPSSPTGKLAIGLKEGAREFEIGYGKNPYVGAEFIACLVMGQMRIEGYRPIAAMWAPSWNGYEIAVVGRWDAIIVTIKNVGVRCVD